MESSAFALTQPMSKNSSVEDCYLAFDASLPQQGASLLYSPLQQKKVSEETREGYSILYVLVHILSSAQYTLSPTTAQYPVRDELLYRT